MLPDVAVNLGWVTKDSIVFFLAGLISVLGILKIVLPELRHVVRSLWRDYKAAVLEWDDFREQRRKRKRLRHGSFREGEQLMRHPHG